MHEITQQRIDESDLKIAETFQNTGLSQNASIVFVTMLQSNKPEINQTEIAIMSGLPQGVVSRGVNELINCKWVIVGNTVPSEGKGRPTHIYKTVPTNIIVKDMIEHLKTYNETVQADIAKIKETYK